MPRLTGLEEALDVQSPERFLLACLSSLATLLCEDLPREMGERLSRREWEVANLVARGYSNRRIASELVVSERTVDTHVSHILRKLSLVSRAQIAAWAVQQRPRFRVLP